MLLGLVDGCPTVGDHNHSPPASSAVVKPLLIAIAITATFTVVEFVGGLLSGSLALMSDAGHMFTDTLALALSLGAVKMALRPPTSERTFGYLRAEILAALINGATLIVISVVIFYESARRIMDPPEIESGLMLLVASAGLAANGAGVFLLHDKSKGSLNVRGAFLHMFGDMLSSIGVIVGALLIMFLDLKVVDPILSVLIGGIILVGAWKLVTQSTSILLESVPSHLKLDEVRSSLMAVDGVVDVHDLHVWTLSSGLHALSAHVAVKDMRVSDCSGIVARCEEILRDKFAISHTTFQLECLTCEEPVCAFIPHE